MGLRGMSSAHVPFQLIDSDEFEALEVAIAAAECFSTSCKKLKKSENSASNSDRNTCCAQFRVTNNIDSSFPLVDHVSAIPPPNNTSYTLNLERDTAAASWTSFSGVIHKHSKDGSSVEISNRFADENEAARFSENASEEEDKSYEGDSRETGTVLINNADTHNTPLIEIEKQSTCSLNRIHGKPHSTRRLPSWQTNTISSTDARLSSIGDAKAEQNLSNEGARHALCVDFPEDICVDDNRRPWGLAPFTCRALPKRKAIPYLQFKGRISYSVTALDAENAALELLRQVEAKKGVLGNSVPLGFDAEWKAVFKRGAPQRKVAVLQLCIDLDTCNVFHVIHTGIPSPLRTILEDPLVFKVGVGAYGDADRLCRDYNIKVTSVKDLSSMASVKLKSGKSWSLSSLTEELLGKQLDKNAKIRTGDWEIEALSEAQLRYAATDAFASLYLFQVLLTFPDAQKNEAAPEVTMTQVDPGTRSQAQDVKL